MRLLRRHIRVGHRLRSVGFRCAHEETGIALATAVLVLAVLSGVGTTVVVYTNAGYRDSARSDASADAHALAEAGVNLARATLFEAPSYLDPNAVPESTLELNGGTVTYSGTLDGTTWTLTGTGTMPNPTGPDAAPIERTVSSQLAVTTGLESSASNALWNYIYSDSLSPCGTKLENDIVIDVPVYIRGDLCMENEAQITGSVVQVKGTVTIEDTASIGTAGSPIQAAHVGGGCSYGGGAPVTPCTDSQRVYAQQSTDTPEDLSKPPVDLARWYADAKPGPSYGCTTGSFPGGFDNDSTMNASRAVVDLMPSSAYDCRVVEDGVEVGRLSWTPGAPGALVVSGTIFFDGPIKVSDGKSGVYQGAGTIYSSSWIKFEEDATLCGVAACDGTWDPNDSLLVFVAGSSSVEAFKMEDATVFQGGVYAVGGYKEENDVVRFGPVIADTLKIENSAQNFITIDTLLPGMPASYEEVVQLVDVEGGYSG